MADAENMNSEANERSVVKAWRAWRTAHEMVQDRGYELAEDEVKISLDAFRSQYTSIDGTVSRERMKFSARPSPEMLKKYTPPATPGNPDPQPDIGTIWVEFNDDTSVGAEAMRKFAKFCSHEHYRTGMMILSGNVSSAAKKEIPKFAQWTTIEWFLEEDLLINITHHELVPRHVILSREEKMALLKRYRLKETQLPRILQRDPVAKYFGMRRGQIVKIIRSKYGVYLDDNGIFDGRTAFIVSDIISYVSNPSSAQSYLSAGHKRQLQRGFAFLAFVKMIKANYGIMASEQRRVHLVFFQQPLNKHLLPDNIRIRGKNGEKEQKDQDQLNMSIKHHDKILTTSARNANELKFEFKYYLGYLGICTEISSPYGGRSM
ncbi:hypothetical protein FHL15_000105 [Xylaria flabelliformis]|uniref:DNA-directed RNA polymerases I, II, and III subunit RPABC1 n=1 Tax=Xylaria flabelliformis TaxID=2512241 RepID=A0A553IEX9_9PEZI|nr:hypothetical protein FHL15_000105 [Xylaria flabelliformis]